MVSQESRKDRFENIRLMVSTMNEGYARYDVPKNRFVINEFSGFNATAARANGEMGEMQNLTGDEYPNLYQRAGRAEVALPDGMTNIQKIFRANGKLCYIADGKLWYDGKAVADIPAEGEKSVAVCNGKICVMPDKVFYDYVNDEAICANESVIFVNTKLINNSLNTGEGYRCYKNTLEYYTYYYMKNSLVYKTYSLYFKLDNLFMVGDEVWFYDLFGKTQAARVVTAIGDGKIEFDDNHTFVPFEIVVIRNGERLAQRIILNFQLTSSSADNLMHFERKYYSYSEGERSEDISERMRKLLLPLEKCVKGSVRYYSFSNEKYYSDTVEYDSALLSDYNEDPDVGLDTFTYTVKFANGYLSSYDWVILDYGNDDVIPRMDYMCEKDNRIFGVCSSDNTVVASKLGDPFKFFYFSGTSLDSYSVDVGSDGEFTGICSYAGDIVLFKERHIHVLSGTKPSLYQLSGIEAFGIEKGSNASLASLDGRLYYKSLRGIMAFEGTYPRCISQRLGNTRYSEAIGADDGRKYYVSMKNQGGERELFVYDTETALWHREDGTDVVSMCEVGGALNIATKDSVFCTLGDCNERVPWSAVFGPFDLYSENKKLVSTLALRYKLSEGARFEIAVSFDGGEYEVLREVFYSAGTALECDVRLKRCNEFSVRLSGEGYCRVLGMSMELREGSMK